MVVWLIILSVILALCCFACLTAIHRVNELAKMNGSLAAQLVQAVLFQKKYTDEAVLAHEKMAHTGYEEYVPKS